MHVGFETVKYSIWISNDAITYSIRGNNVLCARTEYFKLTQSFHVHAHFYQKYFQLRSLWWIINRLTFDVVPLRSELDREIWNSRKVNQIELYTIVWFWICITHIAGNSFETICQAINMLVWFLNNVSNAFILKTRIRIVQVPKHKENCFYIVYIINFDL